MVWICACPDQYQNLMLRIVIFIFIFPSPSSIVFTTLLFSSTMHHHKSVYNLRQYVISKLIYTATLTPPYTHTVNVLVMFYSFKLEVFPFVFNFKLKKTHCHTKSWNQLILIRIFTIDPNHKCISPRTQCCS